MMDFYKWAVNSENPRCERIRDYALSADDFPRYTSYEQIIKYFHDKEPNLTYLEAFKEAYTLYELYMASEDPKREWSEFTSRCYKPTDREQYDYRGCRFKSQNEVRWAMFFDITGIGWAHLENPVDYLNPQFCIDEIQFHTGSGFSNIQDVYVYVLDERDHAFHKRFFREDLMAEFACYPNILVLGVFPTHRKSLDEIITFDMDTQTRTHGVYGLRFTGGIHLPSFITLGLGKEYGLSVYSGNWRYDPPIDVNLTLKAYNDVADIDLCSHKKSAPVYDTNSLEIEVMRRTQPLSRVGVKLASKGGRHR